MNINVDPRFISHVAKNWEDRDTQEMIEAMVAELKKDCREALLHYSGRSAEEVQAYWENLMGQVQSEDFWCQVDHLLHFHFDY